jgi:hypothetical protein
MNKYINIFYWYVLRWFVGIVILCDGVLQTITLGFYNSAISLRMMAYFADRYYLLEEKTQKDKKIV